MTASLEAHNLIILFTFLNVIFLWIHELDASRKGEWRMFGFLSGLKENMQRNFYLFAHIPLLLFTIYYLWTVINFHNFTLWIIWNGLMFIHLLIHLYAKRWKSNVFKSSSSFIFIYLTAITAFINLLLSNYY
ncbi:hypothetical protein GGR21_001369 [Dysgonomonas hofstadii]|uniref:Uncharacterized protein n=1 Tax=Dysgonomonas hofstadii TaxID=637886 RepID=A0A840CJE4_9BACT|nr:DUF6713 family protein [Dysgonomonas hofstadii]MBB4035476.1 hypothetical protein [Dysgonomonas hofstadii]